MLAEANLALAESLMINAKQGHPWWKFVIYYVGQELSENLCTCSVDCSSTAYDVQITSERIHI
jgi:hypothetical protein